MSVVLRAETGVKAGAAWQRTAASVLDVRRRVHDKFPGRQSWSDSSVFYSVTLRRLVAHTHTHPFNGPFFWVSRYQKGKTNLDFTEARDREWQWHQLGRMHVCTSLQTDNHASIPPLSFLQAGCPSCHPTNSVKALSAPLSGNKI